MGVNFFSGGWGPVRKVGLQLSDTEIQYVFLLSTKSGNMDLVALFSDIPELVIGANWGVETLFQCYLISTVFLYFDS